MRKKVIIVYHGIGTEDPFMQVDVQEFQKQVSYLQSVFRIVHVRELLTVESQEPMATIMFDDAFLSAFGAMQFLDGLQIAYDVALIEEYIGMKEYCSLEQLKQLKKACFVFHTKSHQVLAGLQEKELEMQISSEYIDQLLPCEKGILVYPRGIYDEHTKRLLYQKNYIAGLTALPFHVSKRSNLYEIPRICINGYLSLQKFRFLLSIWGNLYLHLAFVKRRLLGQDYLGK